ncbi:trihelix transcription factor ASR3-like [Bidens hawaiensis]|uniref:trihelix transcription factor ASR3-like n=1 Tax=Bidens hawaiensis TaxID=980011 RepID=UPI0040496D12
MALERGGGLTLSSPAPVPVIADEDLAKAPRLPRWTRQELLVLIQGKKVAENRVRRGRTAVLAFGSSQVEPKWSSVSSYCKRHGVNRGPVQCRKRWSNLAGDFKKIKEWESQIKEEAESFWVMRNDLRRERKLPGFFDREVYDILDGGGAVPDGDKDNSLNLSLAPSTAEEEEEDKAKMEEINEVVFDSGRTAAADEGLFSDGNPEKVAPAPIPISGEAVELLSRVWQVMSNISIILIANCCFAATQYDPPPAAADKESSPGPKTYQERERKRKRLEDAEVEETSLQKQLIEAMERNGRLLSSQLEIQNTNSQLDREQRRDHASSLFGVLNKLADAMARIADKL